MQFKNMYRGKIKSELQSNIQCDALCSKKKNYFTIRFHFIITLN